jgi:superfamily II DNA or RNA helicase
MRLANDIEFFRNCFILVPEKGEKSFQTVLIAPEKKGGKARIFCSCQPGGYASCGHAARLVRGCAEVLDDNPQQLMAKTRFGRLFEFLIKTHPRPLKHYRVVDSSGDFPASLTLADRTVVLYASCGDDRERFIERMASEGVAGKRDTLIRHAESFVLTDMERALAGIGETTIRRSEENSMWFRLMYHLFREFSDQDIVFSFSIDESCGNAWIVLRRVVEKTWFIRFTLPADCVCETLRRFRPDEGTERGYSLLEEEAEIDFSVAFDPGGSTMTFTPCIETAGGSGGRVRVPLDAKSFFGDWVYLPPLRSFQRLGQAARKVAAAHWKEPRRISISEAGAFLQNHCDEFSVAPLDGGSSSQDLFLSGGDDLARLRDVRIIRAFDRVDLVPTAFKGDCCDLTAAYVSGESAVALNEILEAQGRGERFLVSGGCIVDLKSIPLRRLDRFMKKKGGKGAVRLPRSALLQLGAAGSVRLKIDKSKPWAVDLQNLMELKPSLPLETPAGYKGSLREYQRTGVSWLLFLCDNGFGGLLCDDMGLGKTHQILVLMRALREQRGNTAPFIVVCPATVLPHWQRLTENFAPCIGVTVIQGTSRNWGSAAGADLVLTTYGALRSDIAEISAIRFGLAVFDEAQNIKNPEAQVTAAAYAVNAAFKICLTGTPIENSVYDLKSLFDVVMPDYLGAHEDFVKDFAAPIEEAGDRSARENLKKLTSPFILRRLKQTVLADLPPKIDDVRQCDLKPEQAVLYDSLLRERGGPLLAQLRNEREPVPYMHILALIGALKQSCDHPALLSGNPQDYERHQSGKWDLFVELLDEILDGGQKAVVYSQYLNMIEIIRIHLERKKIGAAVLTGASRDRGGIARRFNEDDSCRVFVGSLRASGLGIDLAAASTVVHYDRWWNAAREDQATDRVHRIGQTRGVVVYKLISKNTIEERIDKLVSTRRDLSSALLTEDSPEEMKSFSRAELISLLDG